MFRTFGLAAALVMLVACQPKAPAPPPSPSAQVQPQGAQSPVTLAAQVLTVEDAGYPMFTVKVKGGDGSETTLLLNAQAADLGGVQPDDFAGKNATVVYVKQMKPSLLGLVLDGKALLPDAPKDQGADIKTVIGVLSGAAAPTAGDLPDTITVTDAAGAATNFEWFVTPELVPANGKTVTASFTMDAETNITSMKLSP